MIRPLVIRMVAPTLAVSVLLMMLGLGSALYVHRWDARVADDLDERLDGFVYSGDLALALGDVRLELRSYHDTGNPGSLAQAKKSAETAHYWVSQLGSLSFSSSDARVTRLERHVIDIQQRLGAVSRPAPTLEDPVRALISATALPEARELREQSKRAVLEQSRQNQRVGEMLGVSLGVLGLCGATAGVLAGYGVARSIARSIEQLGGSVQSMAETLADEPSERPPPIEGLRELIAAMSQLSEKTAGVVSELEQTRETVARADQMAAVGQLAAGIAHEVRNPLTAVKLLVDTSLEQSRPLSEGDLAVVHDEVERMDEMLGSLLDFARPASVRRCPTDLADVVSQAVDLLRPRASALGVVVECRAQAPLVVSADAQQIRQVVINLLINAIDAQPNGGGVLVEVSHGKYDDAPSCVLRVADAGPGVAGSVSDSLFEPFISTKETGVGLGLAICRRIVRSHGGAIEARNQPGGGAVFTVVIPVQPAESHTAC